MLDGRFGGCARAAAVPAYQHNIAVSLGYARRDSADARFRHEFHMHARGWVRVLEVVYELRQVFDGIDVVMRRRRYEFHAGR